jgi:DNA-binding SARP family transcriptional activator/TolB-like protein
MRSADGGEAHAAALPPDRRGPWHLTTEVLSMPGDFHQAYRRAVSHTGETNWARLSENEQSAAIYRELTALDAERNADIGAGSARSDASPSHTAPPQTVRVRLIGSMKAWVSSGEDILPPYRKSRALLAIIALAEGRPVARTRLSELLWGSRSAHPGQSLRQEVYHLTEAFRSAGVAMIRSERDSLSLRSELVWTDVAEVRLSSPQSPEALSLLDGELCEYLEGITPAFDSWLKVERQRLHDRARELAEAVLNEQSDPDAIVIAARRLLRINRANEGAWRALMRAHLARGERGLAIEAYDRCRLTLADHLNAAPSMETHALLIAIRGAGAVRDEPRAFRIGPEQSTVGDPSSHAAETPVPRGTGCHADLTLGVTAFAHDDDNPARKLAAALTESLTTTLSRFRWFDCVPCHVARAESWVDFLLTGAVRRHGGQLRVSFRLSDPWANNVIVWAARADTAADEDLTQVDAIARRAAGHIDARLWYWRSDGPGTWDDTVCAPAELVRRAASMIHPHDRQDFLRAGGWLKRAVELDPNNASAHAWFVQWSLKYVGQDWAADAAAALRQAQYSAMRAVQLDPEDARGLSLAAHVRAFLERRPDEALRLHERAIAANPALPLSWCYSGLAESYIGNGSEAVRRIRHGKGLAGVDPYDYFMENSLCIAHLLAKQFEEAAIHGRRAIALNPGFSSSHRGYLATMGHLNAREEAASSLSTLLKLEPGFSVERALSRSPFATSEGLALFSEGLRAAGLPWT